MAQLIIITYKGKTENGLELLMGTIFEIENTKKTTVYRRVRLYQILFF